MTDERPVREPWRSRWLPALVISLFALVVLADAAVIILFGNYRNLIEENGVEAVFIPAGPDREAVTAGAQRGGAPAGDRPVPVEASGGAFRVASPGRLVIRFRAPDAGAFVELGYRFAEHRPGAAVELALGRVASRHGVDTLCRRSLRSKKNPGGRFRHYLGDHAGWFELGLDVNPVAAEAGFAVETPEIVRD
jgi:hypothetical protein